MAYADYSKKRSSIAAFEVDSTFSELLEQACNRIHNLGTFYTVGPKVRQQESLKCPACVLVPRSVEIEETHLSGGRFSYDYIVDVLFVVKHPNDCVLIQQVLYFESKIRAAFSIGDGGEKILVFDTVTGHYKTVVRSSLIEPVQQIANNALIYSSGINIVFSVWKNY